MKIVLVFLVGCLAVLTVSGTDQFTTSFDNVNLDDILDNERLFLNYFKCIMGRGKCTADGETLKGAIPTALMDGCARCSEKQKEGTKKVITHLIEFKPEQWAELKAKFDPDGKYESMHLEQFTKKE